MTTPRPRPRLDADNRAFWTGGAEGKLNIMKCGDCGEFTHPPLQMCRHCQGESMAPHAVSGLATVISYTINHQAWMPGLEVPFIIARVRLDDAPGKNPEVPSYTLGDLVTVAIFAPGERVKVTGTSKGRGFQGVVKRHGFGGGPNTHGNTKHRKPGSIGAGTDPSRVIKGKKMPGHYGAAQHTAVGLRVEKVDAERNLIYLRGSVAGPTNGIVCVRKQG